MAVTEGRRSQFEVLGSRDEERLAALARIVLATGIAALGLTLGGPLAVLLAQGLARLDDVFRSLLGLPLLPMALAGAGMGAAVLAWDRTGGRRPTPSGTTLGVGLALAIPVVVVLGYGALPYQRGVAGFVSVPTLVLLLLGTGLGIGSIIVGFSTYGRMPTKRSREQAIAGAVLGIQAVVIGLLFLGFRTLGNPDRFVFHFFNLEFLEGAFPVFVRGAANTVILAVVGEVGGIILGLLLSFLVLSNRPVVRAPARVYINFFRGTPLIWQLSVFYFGLALGFGLRLELEVGPVQLSSAYVTGMIVFILNTGAYSAEIFRAGIQSIERGQMEAARSLGMSYPQAMRYAIVPQAVRRVIPPLMNEFVIVIKDTSLIVVLGLIPENYDLFTTAREGYSSTANATYFTAAAAGYLVVTLPLIRAVNAVEKRLRSGLVTVTT